MSKEEKNLLDYCKKCNIGNEFNPNPCQSCLIVPAYIKNLKQDEEEYDLMHDLHD